jgi:hypothetical protein
MGKELGGKRGDKEYQADDGKVDYEKRRQSLEFQHGIKRLRDAWDQGLRLALLCSESRPEYCHRSRVIGPALEEVGIEVTHLDEDGTPMTQQKVMTRLAGGQQSLPGMAPPQAARSRHRYRTGQE